MFADIVLVSRNEKIENFGKKLGFGRILFLDDIKALKIVKGGDDKTNRAALENKATDMLLLMEFKKTYILNQVLCKLAKANDIAIALSFEAILNYDHIELGNVITNISLCSKYKVKMVMASFATDRFDMVGASDLLSFCKVLGMSPGQAKNSLDCVLNILKRKERSKGEIAPGIMVIK